MGKNYFDRFDTMTMQLSPPSGVTEITPFGGRGPLSLSSIDASQGNAGLDPAWARGRSAAVMPAPTSGGNYFDRFDLQSGPPNLPKPPSLPDWMTNPAPADRGDVMQLIGMGGAPPPAANGTPAGTGAPAVPMDTYSNGASTPSTVQQSYSGAPPAAPKLLYSRLILGMKNAFGGDYSKTRQWFANNGYGDLLRSSAPSEPSMFDRYWTMLGQYDADKQQADAARKVGFGEAFAREGLRGLAGITEYENRLLLPAYWGIDATSRALTGYNPNFGAIPDAEAEQRNSLAIQPYEELTVPGQIGAGFGQALPMVATAPIVDAALPEEALARVPEVAPTLWNATKEVAARIPRGIGAMMPSAALAAQDVADQGGSPQDQFKAASLTMAMGAIPMLMQSGAPSLPLRIAERGAKSAALAMPVSAFLNNLQDPSRRTTAGFTADDIVSAIPQIVTGALTGGRELPFRGSVEAPVTNPIWRDAKPPTVSEPFLDRMRAVLDSDAAAEAARRSGDITFSKEQTPAERVGHGWLELGKDARTAVLGETPTEKDFPSILRKLAGSLSNEIEVSENRAPNGEVWAYQFTEPRNPGRVILLDLGVPGEAYVNSSMAGEHSTPIYQAIYAWAHNSGHRIVEDPVGLSKVAQLRRASQMLSSAIRYGTTRHMVPGPHSGIQGWRAGEGWETTAHNIGLLARREAELVRERLPFVRQMRYVPKEDAFYDGNQQLPAKDLDSYLWQRIAGVDPKFAKRIGPSTLKRALVTLAAERADFGGFGRLVGASSKEAPLNGVRYGKTQKPIPSAAGRQAAFSRHVAAIQSAALDEVGRLRTPPHIVVHRDSASIGNDYLRRRVQEENARGRGKVNAFYHSGTHAIHLLADGVRDENHARAMVRHEALHAAIRKNPAFRSEYARLLRNLARTLPGDARQRLESLYGRDSTARIVEEYLAQLAESDPTHSLWRQFITSFKLMASRFLGDRIHFNEADIQEFIRRNLRSRSPDIASRGTNAVLDTGSAAVSDRMQKPLFSKPSVIKGAHAHFGKDLAAYLRGTLPSNKILDLGLSGGALELAGAPRRRITMTQRVLEKAYAHGIDLRSLLDLPRELYDPVMIFDSHDSTGMPTGNKVVLTRIKTIDGRVVVAALALEQSRQGLGLINDIRSVHGKEHVSRVLDWALNKQWARYINQRKTRAFLQDSAPANWEQYAGKLGQLKVPTERDLRQH